jgi:hypothetical protein
MNTIHTNIANCKKFIFVLPLLLVACGTYQLAGGIRAPSGTTSNQQQNDILFCKDQAHLEANSGGQQAKAFLMGLTIVGAPIAIEQEKALSREVFARCMTSKGYAIAPVPATNPEPAAQPTQIAKAAPSNSQQDDVAVQLERVKNLRDRGLITADESDQMRKRILDSMRSSGQPLPPK